MIKALILIELVTSLVASAVYPEAALYEKDGSNDSDLLLPSINVYLRLSIDIFYGSYDCRVVPNVILDNLYPFIIDRVKIIFHLLNDFIHPIF